MDDALTVQDNHANAFPVFYTCTEYKIKAIVPFVIIADRTKHRCQSFLYNCYTVIIKTKEKNNETLCNKTLLQHSAIDASISESLAQPLFINTRS